MAGRHKNGKTDHFRIFRMGNCHWSIHLISESFFKKGGRESGIIFNFQLGQS